MTSCLCGRGLESLPGLVLVRPSALTGLHWRVLSCCSLHLALGPGCIHCSVFQHWCSSWSILRVSSRLGPHPLYCVNSVLCNLPPACTVPLTCRQVSFSFSPGLHIWHSVDLEPAKLGNSHCFFTRLPSWLSAFPFGWMLPLVPGGKQHKHSSTLDPQICLDYAGRIGTCPSSTLEYCNTPIFLNNKIFSFS